jgi:hypothetical protein
MTGKLLGVDRRQRRNAMPHHSGHKEQNTILPALMLFGLFAFLLTWVLAL